MRAGRARWRLASRLDATALEFRHRGKPLAAVWLHRLAVRLASESSLPRLLNNLGVACKLSGRLDEADDAYQRADAVLARVPAADPALVASLFHNVAGLDHALGDAEAGEATARSGLAIREQLVGTDHPDVARDLIGLAALVEAQGRFDDAEAIYVRGIEMLERHGRLCDLDVAVALNNLAAIALQRGNLDNAEELCRAAIAHKTALLGATHPEVALTNDNLAVIQAAYSAG